MARNNRHNSQSDGDCRSCSAVGIRRSVLHDTLDVLALVLRRERYECMIAEAPDAAISIFETHASIDLVVSDYDLPLMNGLELRNKLGGSGRTWSLSSSQAIRGFVKH